MRHILQNALQPRTETGFVLCRINVAVAIYRLPASAEKRELIEATSATPPRLPAVRSRTAVNTIPGVDRRALTNPYSRLRAISQV